MKHSRPVFQTIRHIEQDVHIQATIEQQGTHFVWAVSMGAPDRSLSLGGECSSVLKALSHLRNFLVVFHSVMEDSLLDVKQAIDIACDSPIGGMEHFPDEDGEWN